LKIREPAYIGAPGSKIKTAGVRVIKPALNGSVCGEAGSSAITTPGAPTMPANANADTIFFMLKFPDVRRLQDCNPLKAQAVPNF
jgi:hypothetical protein